MICQEAYGAIVDCSSPLFVTDMCRSLGCIFRVGPVASAAGAMAWALCERSMPHFTERPNQFRFEVCGPEHLAKIQRKPDSIFRQGPHGEIVDLGSHLSVTDRCRSLVDKLRGGQWVAEAMVSSLCESRMPQSTERLIRASFEVCSPTLCKIVAKT